MPDADTLAEQLLAFAFDVKGQVAWSMPIGFNGTNAGNNLGTRFDEAHAVCQGDDVRCEDLGRHMFIVAGSRSETIFGRPKIELHISNRISCVRE
jgi:hypothetical protein